VAIFVSVQSGDFYDPATWNTGSVPDLSVDDVVIGNDHEVVLGPGHWVTLAPGRLIAVAAGGTLRIQGGLDVDTATVWVDGTVFAEGDYLAIWNGSEMPVSTTGVVIVPGSFYLESGATATIEGQFVVESDGYADIYSDGLLTLQGGGLWQNYGSCTVEYSGRAVVHGDFTTESNGSLDLYDDGVLEIASDGAVFVLGSFCVDWHGRCEVFGYLGIEYDGLFYVYADGLGRVYKDIHASVRTFGGGRSEMLRREGRILDYDGNPMFALDRAYGLKPARIA